MNTEKKIIITDTNIITNLYIAGVLEEFILLDNIYISDIVKTNEINNKTCDLKLISKFKTVEANSMELLEASYLSIVEKKLSIFDLLNFIICRDNNYILATGDNQLKEYSESHNIEVIRTLKIIKDMYNSKIISNKKSIDACNKLKESSKTRIPIKEIDNLINYLKKY